MIYYTIKFDETHVVLCSNSESELPTVPNAIITEITQEKFNELRTGIADINNVIYQKADGTHGLRRFDTMWDDTSQSWIPDAERIAQIKKSQLIFSAKSQLDKTSRYDLPRYRSRLTEEQNQANDAYRVQLWDIVECKIEVDELPQDPNELLKG